MDNPQSQIWSLTSFSHIMCNTSTHCSFLSSERFMSLSLIWYPDLLSDWHSIIIKQVGARVCFYWACNLLVLDLAFKMTSNESMDDEQWVMGFIKMLSRLKDVGGHKIGHKYFSAVICDQKHQSPHLSCPWECPVMSDCCTLALALLFQAGCER